MENWINTFPGVSLTISFRARSSGRKYFNSVASCSLVDSGFDKKIGCVGSSLKHIHWFLNLFLMVVAYFEFLGGILSSNTAKINVVFWLLVPLTTINETTITTITTKFFTLSLARVDEWNEWCVKCKIFALQKFSKRGRFSALGDSAVQVFASLDSKELLVVKHQFLSSKLRTVLLKICF